MASLKYAVTCLPLWVAWYISTPPATSRPRRVRSRPPIRIVIIAGTSWFRGLAPGLRARAGRQVGLGHHAAQVGVEPAAVAQGVAEQPVIRPGQGERLLQVGLVAREDRGHLR